LRRDLSALPEWMRVIVRDLLQQANAGAPPPVEKAKPSRRASAPAPIMKRRGVRAADDEGFQTVLAASDEERRDLLSALPTACAP